MDQIAILELNNKYKSLNKEVSKLNLKGRKPEFVYLRLPKIYNAGFLAKESKKHDQAYILFKRWIVCCDWLLKQKLKKDIIETFLSNDKIEDVRNLLQEVSNSIKLEYETKQIKDTCANSVTQDSTDVNVDLELRLPETPNDEPQPKENDEITCTELLNILNQGIQSSKKRLLIIDLRNEEDYLESRIAFPENIVHIPAEKIESNKSPDFYRHLFLHDSEALDRYKKRSAKDVDIIVLLDSNSSLNTVKINSPIHIFRKSLKECDPNTKYKRVAILKGGFEEWIESYPGFVTDPVRQESNLSFSTPSSSVSYNFLNLDQEYDKVSSPTLSGRHPARPRVKDPSNVNSQVSTRSDKNSSSLYNSLLNSHQKQLASSTMQNGKYTHPSALTFQNNNPTAPPLQNGISDKQLLLSNNIKEAKVLVEKYKPPVDRSNKPSKLGGMPTMSQLEKQLIDIQYSIKQYETKLLKGIQDDWAREQLETLRKKEQEIMTKLGRPRNNIRSADENAGNIYPDLSNISLGLRTRAVRPLRSDFNEEKENIPKPLEKDKSEPMLVDPQPSLTPPRMEVDEEEIIRKEPLKSDNISVNLGLKRSHSSPNLVQVKKLKANHQNLSKSIPAVNRSLKPNQVSANISRSHINQAVSWKSREQRFEPVFSSTQLHPGITGLKNLGNSCYMNSIIQCLSNTVYLAKYFTDNMYTDHLNRNVDKVARAYVAEEVAQVIKALWRGQYKSISPRDLKNVIGQYKMQFENFEQQDSHEFLTFLLDWMHNDLKQNSKVTYDRPLTVAESEWEKSMKGQSSVISKLFFGQLRSTIECLYCEQNSTTYENFNSLTMSLPDTNKCTLDECVRKFVSGQRVSDWKCPNCKVPRDGMKKFDIAKLPHIIVIHLNRFGEASGWLEKKNTAVDFPLVNFNMRQYVVQDNFNNSPSNSYNLYAMSNHYGTMDGGHYTAYCKSNHQNKWYKYDDHTVSEVHANTVKSQSTSAYLLFYASASAENYLNS